MQNQSPREQLPRMTSTSPSPRQREQTPTESELARALLSLSFNHPENVAVIETPPSRPPTSSHLPGAYPETPLPPAQLIRFNGADALHTPIRDSHEAQSVQYPRLDSLQSSSEPHSIPTPPTTTTQSFPPPTPEQTPEPSEPRSRRTIVVVHDSCPKHKFSRNVKARELASIVERPERCRASVLGIAAAKARLELESSIDLSFDITKSTRLGSLSDPAVIDVHGLAWPKELSGLCDNALETLAKGQLEIPPPYHSGDLYLGEGSHEAIRGCIGAVYDGVDSVLADGYDRVHVSIRPPGHHCAETTPSGFCLINNIHIAIAYAHRKYGISRAVILDFDLHHGDGSQAIAWHVNEMTNQEQRISRSPRHNATARGLQIAYLSLHDIYSFPCEDSATQKIQDASLCLSAHGQTIWNVHLRHYTSEAAFNEVYTSEYSILFKRAAQFLTDADPADKCMVFLSAGFDGSEHESKGMQRHGYNLPTQFYQKFANDATTLANTYASGKILSVLEGGYADRAISSGTFAYMVGLSGVTEESANRKSSNWWSVARLAMLEKWSKKPFGLKANGGLQDQADVQWLQQTLNIAMTIFPSAFVSCDATIDPSLMATPRMELRERKKPSIPSVAPPSTVKRRQQRVPTPRPPKSMSATDIMKQEGVVPPVPKLFEKDASPGMELAPLMKTMRIKEGDASPSPVNQGEDSVPGTPTPARRGDRAL
jgi:acetoin utilization deacetylase AcuC-like enzyme